MPRKPTTSLVFLCLLAAAAPYRLAAQRTTLQPVDSSRGVQIVVDGTRAWALDADGRAQRLRLRRGERPTAVAETRDGWIAAGIRQAEGRRELFLLRHQPGARARLKAPAGTDALFRLAPVLLVDRGTLAGLAWLEGTEPGRLAVRAAAWTGSGWTGPETVAAPGPGSQTGLTGVVLGDGSWLLAWAAHDGDDDIVWSRRSAEGWSRPRPLHPGNQAPDVTPALIAGGDGAVAAWSRIVGDRYQIAIATFDGNGWGSPRAIPGSGSLYPTFVRSDGEAYLLLRSADPRGWELLELSPEGRVRRRSLTAADSPVRPTLERTDRGRLALRWPEEERPRPVAWEGER